MNLDQTFLRSLINSYDEIVSLPEGYPALNAESQCTANEKNF